MKILMYVLKYKWMGDKLDFVENPEDAKKVIRQIQEKLAELEGKPAGKYFTDNQHAKGQELG